MLSQKYPSFDTDFKQYLMSLVGTVIYQPGTSDSKGPTFKFLGQGDPALITALLDGGNSASVYACDTTDKCLNPASGPMAQKRVADNGGIGSRRNIVREMRPNPSRKSAAKPTTKPARRW
jgi:hypothetical protein